MTSALDLFSRANAAKRLAQRERNAAQARSGAKSYHIETLQNEITLLREALRPFAEIPCLENFEDDQMYETHVTAADVRAARRALYDVVKSDVE